MDTTFVIDQADLVLDLVEEFLTGTPPAHEPNRVLASVLLTDIVGSTDLAARLGDRAWKQLLDRHDDATRAETTRHGGRVVKTTGDGVLATFDGPGKAIRCARALGEALKPTGIEIRAGLHTGEIELRTDGDVGGIAVHIAARIAALASADEILVSRTVTDLVVGLRNAVHRPRRARPERGARRVATLRRGILIHGRSASTDHEE